MQSKDFLTAEGLYKPDVLAVHESGEKAFIVDHTVVWDRGNLMRHFDEKEKYYSRREIIEKVKQLHPIVQSVEVCGLVIGAWGVWGCRNDKLWHELGLPASLNSSMLMATLYGHL